LVFLNKRNWYLSTWYFFKIPDNATKYGNSELYIGDWCSSRFDRWDVFPAYNKFNCSRDFL